MKNLKMYKKWNWSYIEFELSPNHLHTALVMLISEIKISHVVYLIAKISEGFNQYRTFNHQIIIGPDSNADDILKILEYGLAVRQESGTLEELTDAVLKYRPFEGESINIIKKEKNWATPEYVESAKIKKRFLEKDCYPISCEDKDFGELLSTNNNIKTFKYSKDVLIEREILNLNLVKNRVYIKNVKSFSFTDEIKPDGSWVRHFNKLSKYYDKFNNFQKYENILDVKYIKPLKICTRFNSNILTLDIETKMYPDGNFEPVAIAVCYGDDYEVEKFYITEYASVDQMLSFCFKFIISNFPNCVIYAHNMGRFDSLFFLNSILKEYEVIPTMKDGRFLSIEVKTKQNENFGLLEVKMKRKSKIIILDSYNFLPTSLRKLTEIFNTKTKKGYFPFEALNELGPNYVGVMPDKKYFENLSIDDYNELKNNFWSCKENLLNYLTHDVISLREIIIIFNNFIKSEFLVDMTKYKTISSLSFAIIRTIFFEEAINKLIILNGKFETIFRQAYYGGRVEVFKPRLKNGYMFDVNGLYPFIMANYPMPGGSMKHIKYNTYIDLDNSAYGIAYVKIKTPDNLYNPTIPFRLEDGSIVYPIGEWEGWYNTEELKHASEKKGYIIKVLEIFQFEKQYNMFTKFVTYFNNMKINSTGFKRTIAKNIMNFGFGKLGSHIYNTKTVFVNAKEADLIASQFKIVNHKELPNNMELITYIPNNTYKSLLESKKPNQNTSLPVAISLTALGRVINATYLDKASDIYYTDCDSFAVKEPYPSDMIDQKELGKLKLVHAVESAIFASGKLYGIVDENYNTHIKAKGLGPIITIDELNDLIQVNTITKIKEVWVKQLEKGNIKISNINYVLKLANTKRLKIIINGQWVDTTPHKIFNNKISPLELIPYEPNKVT